jgi:signal transduction histidine kinase
MRSYLMRFQRWVASSIGRQLIFASMVFWMAALALLGLGIILIGRAELSNEIRQRNVQLASIISRDVNAQISSLTSDVRVFCRRLESIDPALEHQAAAMIDFRLAAQGRYYGIYLFDGDGGALLSITSPAETLLALSASDILGMQKSDVNAEAIKACEMTGPTETYVSGVTYTWLSKIPILYIGKEIAVPGRESRIAVFEIDLTSLWQRIDLGTVGLSGFTYAISEKGWIIAHPQASQLGRTAPGELAPLLRGYEGFTEYRDAVSGRVLTAAYSPVGQPSGWGIVVVQDKAEANASLTRASTFIGIIWASLSILGMLGIAFMVRGFTRPIIGLTRTAGNIAQTGNLTQATLAHRPDELGSLSRAFDAMIAKIKESEGKLAQAALDERNRLARELHDAVSQTLFSASIIAEVIPRIWEKNPDEARRRLDEVKQLTRGALAEMRTLLFELRPAALADAEISHLLKQLAESIGGRARIPVAVTVNTETTFAVPVKIALYRITQEALNNVAKHSRATQATISLSEQSGTILLMIRDNGQGFDAGESHDDSLGLKIMRERAIEAGAVLDVASVPGEGTCVSVTVHSFSSTDNPP